MMNAIITYCKHILIKNFFNILGESLRKKLKQTIQNDAVISNTFLEKNNNKGTFCIIQRLCKREFIAYFKVI